MKIIQNSFIALMFLGVMLVHTDKAEASSVDEMMATVQSLMTQIEGLKNQLNAVRGEVKGVMKKNLKEGMTDVDVAKIQELLATDPTIYPEGKKTGFFGPLTREALKRFQNKNGLTTSGTIDSETQDLLEEYLKEGFGNAKNAVKKRISVPACPISIVCEVPSLICFKAACKCLVSSALDKLEIVNDNPDNACIINTRLLKLFEPGKLTQPLIGELGLCNLTIIFNKNTVFIPIMMNK